MIIATAGHIDHGKSTLIRALTGVDTDRLPEEKARGISIDLGFAHWRDPGGRVVSFVDVPGHERFIRNMLAGVSGIDAAMLVVAADDGPMPQTAEHLEILELLGVRTMVVVLTKIDRVAAERITAATDEVRALVAGTRYRDAPVFPVDGVRRTGVDALAAALGGLAEDDDARRRAGGFRMSVDRSFIAPGEGLVVTGTIASGEIAAGAMVRIAPRGLEARVRGIRVAGEPADTAGAGVRCAINLAGQQVERTSATRGDWIVDPMLDRATASIDVRLRLAGGVTLRPDQAVHAFLGTDDVPGRLLSLEAAVDDSAHGGPLYRLRLDRPMHAVRGDRIVIRDATNARTLAGAIVLDPLPDAVKVKRTERIAMLEALSRDDPADALAWMARTLPMGADLSSLPAAWNMPSAALVERAEALGLVLVRHRGGVRALAADDVARAMDQIEGAISAFHAAHESAIGPDRAALLAALTQRMRPLVVEHALAELIRTRRIVRQGAAFRLPGHRPKLVAADARLWDRMRPLIESAGVRPLRVVELAEHLKVTTETVQATLDRVCTAGLAFRVAPNRCFLRAQLHALARVAEDLAAASASGTIAPSEYKDASGIGRNLTIEVLEFFDRVQFTKRAGNARTLLASADDLFGE